MKRSQRSITLTTVKSEQSRMWTQGEDFNFKSLSSSKNRSRPRRETIVAAARNVKDVPSKQSMRESYIIKRLEADLSPKLSNSPISRRTRRQSLASFSQVQHKSKTQMQRAKSDKVIRKSSPTTSKQNVKTLSPKITLKRVAVESSKGTKGKDRPPIKESKKSPVRTRRRNMVNRDSMTKLVQTKMPSPPTSKKKVNLVEDPKDKQQPSPPKVETQMTASTSSKSQTSSKTPAKAPAKTKSKTPAKSKSKTPKPVKRLSVATPSPRLLGTRRSTRSSTRKAVKKVQIVAQSPTGGEHYRRTPKDSRSVQMEIESDTPAFAQSVKSRKRISPKSLKPFTPKVVEPSKLLKQTLKRKVASEMIGLAIAKRDVSQLLNTEIATVTRTRTKTPAKSPERRLLSDRSVKDLSFESSSYDLPVTPVSCRKSILSESRFRSSRRQINSPRFSSNDLSNDKLISSTPVKMKPGGGSESMLANIDISEVSNTSGESSFTASFTKSFSSNTSVVSRLQEQSVDEVEKSPQVTQSNKKSYCSVM